MKKLQLSFLFLFGSLKILSFQAPWTKTHIPWSTNINYIKHETHYTFFKTHLESPAYKEISSRGFILVPGLGDVPFLMGPLEHSKLIPSDHWHTVYFNDARSEKTLSTSLGQNCEIVSTLKTIKSVHIDYESLGLIGESRGGAATVNTIAVLAQPHHKLLQKADISETERIIILQKLQKGCIFLRAPLILFKDVAATHTNNTLGSVINFVIAPLITNFKYNPKGEQAINSLEYWNQLKIPTLICFASHDSTLGSNLNEAFVKKFEEKNGKNFTWHYTFEGCHIKSGDLFYEQLIPYFLMQQSIENFAYNPKKQLVYQWIEVE